MNPGLLVVDLFKDISDDINMYNSVNVSPEKVLENIKELSNEMPVIVSNDRDYEPADFLKDHKIIEKYTGSGFRYTSLDKEVKGADPLIVSGFSMISCVKETIRDVPDDINIYSSYDLMLTVSNSIKDINESMEFFRNNEQLTMFSSYENLKDKLYKIPSTSQ
ncbi:MAG: hypothetical protein ACQEP1_05020 [Nanobdellota archaeon]